MLFTELWETTMSTNVLKINCYNFSCSHTSVRNFIISYHIISYHIISIERTFLILVRRDIAVFMLTRRKTTINQSVISYHIISYQSLNLGGRRGTTDGFATIPFYPSLSFAALREPPNPIPVHSLMLRKLYTSIYSNRHTSIYSNRQTLKKDVDFGNYLRIHHLYSAFLLYTKIS